MNSKIDQNHNDPKQKEQLAFLNQQQMQMTEKWSEYMDGILGTKTHVAVRAINADQKTSSRAPIRPHEASHVDRVVNSLRHASESTRDDLLKKKLEDLARILSLGVFNEDFDARAVSFDIFNLLHEYEKELGKMKHLKHLTPDGQMVELNDEMEDVRKRRDSLWDQEDLMVDLTDNGMSLKDLLRLEMFKLSSSLSEGEGGGGGKLENILKHFEAEIEKVSERTSGNGYNHPHPTTTEQIVQFFFLTSLVSSLVLH